ncbi:MAG: carboxymuconolactone decarboxylase family protein [Jatrophihabitans sp.]|uniref:carboxymuconolactone decarboxylase family protein n=1 Tax=Jatrophihabitans sp. TaxID=1932789 RepID=UPI003912C204
MARIAPLDPPYSTDVAAQLARMMPPGVEPIALFRLFARNLPMAQAMSGWGSYELSRRLSLTLREREIVIDRTCARAGCEYEWGVHISIFAGRAGLRADQVRSLTAGDADDPCWTEPRDKILIRVVDALFDSRDLDDDLWQQLGRHLDEAETLDLLLLCGWYQAISLVGRVTRLPNEPGAPTFASVDVVGPGGDDVGRDRSINGSHGQ